MLKLSFQVFPYKASTVVHMQQEAKILINGWMNNAHSYVRNKAEQDEEKSPASAFSTGMHT